MAHDQDRVDATADVVRQVHPVDADPAGARVDVELDDRGAVRVGRGRTDARALVPGGGRRRRVGADRADGAEPRLGRDDRVRERQGALRPLDIEDLPAAKPDALGGDSELLGHGRGQELARAFRRLDRRVAHHESHAAAVRAEIDRCQVGVAEHDADVVRIDPEHLGDHLRQHRVGALSDVDLAAEDRHSPAAVQLELHARVRHVVPVDRQPRAADVGRARQADPLARRQVAELLFPPRALDHRVDALRQPHRPDTQVVGGQRLGRHEVPEAQRGGVDPKPLGDLVEVHFEGEAGLRGAVTAFRAAGRLVGEAAQTVEFVVLHRVRHGLERSGVIRAGDAV